MVDMSIRDEFRSYIEDHEIYQSDFVDRHVVTALEGLTPFGCLRQATRELFRCQRGLEELYAARETLLTEIAELDGSLRPLWMHAFRWLAGPGYRRKQEIKLGAKRAALPHLAKNIEDTARRFRGFFAQVRALRPKVGKLTPEARSRYEAEWWVAHFMVDLMLNDGRGLSKDGPRRLAAMPPEVRRAFQGERRRYQQALQAGDRAKVEQFEAEYLSAGANLLSVEPADIDVHGLLGAGRMLPVHKAFAP